MSVSNLPKLYGVNGRKHMYESADDEHEEQDQRRDSASGGKSKTPRLPVDPPSSLGADSLTSALETLPTDDWNRTWAADRTMMLRMTSKRVKNAVDNLCPPTIVVMLTQEELLDRYQIYFVRPAFGTKYILKQLEKMTARFLITNLDIEVSQIGDDGGRRLAIADPAMLKDSQNHLPTPSGPTNKWVLDCCRM
jgi:hypothetical protein